ncbi:MAG: exodeoxyribonuclease V subunit gamma [Burkholderiaceae bacterium]
MLRILLDADANAQAERAIAWLAAVGGDPLAPDTLVVGQPATGYWLQHRMAALTGISANLAIERPVGFLWRELAAQLPGTNQVAPFEALRVRWAIHGALDDALAGGPLPDDASSRLLIERWRQASDTERVHFATRLARLLDGYQSYRRDWTQAWARNRGIGGEGRQAPEHESWQQWLWREVLGRLRGYSPEHPFESLRRQRDRDRGGSGAQMSLFEAVLAAPGATKPAPGSQAPGRIVLFGALGLSPDQLETLARLALQRPMLWLATDPAIGFWHELVSPARAARLARDEPSLHALFETEPALLGQWGREQRDTLAMLRELEQRGLAEIGDSALRSLQPAALPVCAPARLAIIQRAILTLDDSIWRDPAVLAARQHRRDESLEIHAAHTLSRQVDVAYDRLMAAFDAVPDLRADQAAVFCVDLDAAEPWLRARFEADAARALPLAFSGRSAHADPGVAAVLGLLSMVNGELSAQALIAWLDADWARRRFGLTDDDLRALRRALDAAGWRVDDLGAARAHRYGWRTALSRLALGACHDVGALEHGSPQRIIGGIWPVAPGEADALHVLSVACALIDEIAQLRAHAPAAPISLWVQWLESFCVRWPGADPALQPGLSRIRAAAARVLEQATDTGVTELTLSAFAQALDEPLEQGARIAWPQGAITVAPLGSLRGVPYRVVVVIGLDDGAWPARAVSHEFDLMRARPRFGDPSPGDRARAEMLDLLRETSDRLILTYAGRDPRDNGERPPSRVLGELIEYLAGVDPCWTDRPCVRQHPLQSFSPRRFGADLPSYDAAWADAARVLAGERRWPVIGPVMHAPGSGPREGGAGEAFTLLDLERALGNPQRHLLFAALGARLPGIDALVEPHEAFEADEVALTDHARMTEMVVLARRAGRAESELLQALAAHPASPPGLALAPFASALIDQADALLAAERACLAALGLACETDRPVPARPLRLRLGDGLTLVGGLPEVWTVHDQPVVVEPLARAAWPQILRAWVRYLFWQASDDACPVSWLIACPDSPSVLGWGPAADRLRALPAAVAPHSCARAASAGAALASLLPALTEPAPGFALAFPRLAGVWVEAGGGVDPAADPDTARVKAARAYLGDRQAGLPGLIDRTEVRAIWRGEPPLLDTVLAASLACFGAPLLAAHGRIPVEEAIERCAAAWADSARTDGADDRRAQRAGQP